MTIRTCAAIALLMGVASVASAQDTQGSVDAQCMGSGVRREAQDACQKAIDLFSFMAPQLSASIAGGNATLGQGQVMGRPGKFAIVIRANAVQGSLPEFDGSAPSITGASSTNYTTKQQYLGLPVADVTVGVIPSFRVGTRKVFGVDAIVSVAYLPEYESSDESFSIRLPDGSLKLGFGGRVGIVQEGKFMPGLGVTYLVRDLPVVSVFGTSASGVGMRDTLSLNELDASTKSVRIVGQKTFALLRLAVGFGQDKYETSSNLGARVYSGLCAAGGCGFDSGLVNFSQTMTRSNAFADLQLNLVLFKLVAEIGQVGEVKSSERVRTFNTFGENGDDTPNDSRTYGSVGIRFGF